MTTRDLSEKVVLGVRGDTGRRTPGEAAGRSGWHAAWTHRSDVSRPDVLARYFDAGLTAGDRLAWIAPPERLQVVPEQLRRLGHDPDRLVAEGRFVLMPFDEAYEPGEQLDPDARLAGYRALVEESVASGFTGFRVAAEVPPRIASYGDEWSAYEFRADILADSMPFTALCCYDERTWDDRALRTILCVHAEHVERTLPHTPSVRLSARGGRLTIAGELDASEAEHVRKILIGSASDLGHPTVDIHGLGFVDAAGLRAIAGAAGALVEMHGEARLVGASSMFMKVWSLVGFDRTLTDVEVVPA